MDNEIKKGPGEVLYKETEDRRIYHYVDEERGIDILSKEIFIKEKKIVHYPFLRLEGRQKYKKVRKITYIGFDDEKKLPRGFYKSWKKGMDLQGFIFQYCMSWRIDLVLKKLL